MIEIKRRETWVGVFDILGFKEIINKVENNFNRNYLISQLEDMFKTIKPNIMENGKLELITFSDTFIILTQDLEFSSYPWFLMQCIHLIERSISIELPLRGAISVGIAYESKNPLIILGKPFVEAYEYSEDQDWIGLLMTPTATKKLREGGLEPTHHDFIECEIPLRKLKNIESENVLAYRFQNGRANIGSHLIPHLKSMQHKAPDSAKEKYSRTINFINKYYQWI
jgi:hypothetical protein